MSIPRATLLGEVPQLIADEIKLVLPDLRQCEGMAGPFNLEDLKASGTASPAVLVSVLGMRKKAIHAGPLHAPVLDLAAYIVTKDRTGLPRDIAAANICQALMGLIPDNRWGETAFGEAEDIRARTLVNRSVKKVAASLWAVTWSQPVTFMGEEAAAPISVELYVGQEPETGAGNEGSYEQIGGQV